MKPIVHLHIARRSGYTLLEVLLVLAITTVLVGAVGSALNIYLRSVEAGRAEVEQAQLARALLRRIADDLRSAVPIVVDDSGVESSTDAAIAAAAGALSGGSGSSGSSGSAGGSGGGSSSGGSSGSANITNITGSTGVTNIDGSQGVTDLSKSGSGSSGSSSSGSGSRNSGTSSAGSSSGGSMSSAMTGASGASGMSGQSGTSSGASGGGSSGSGVTPDENESASESAIAPLGVYGSQYDLQVDVSRLPRTNRIDSLTGTIVADNAAMAFDPPSDVKTVAYYISQQAAIDPSADSAAATVVGGLMRRQVDRSVLNYGAEYGGSTELGTSEQLLAPEATALEFRYFNGTEWLTSWDSSQSGAVPVAVEILLTLRAQEEAAPGDTRLLASPTVPQEQTYRLLVHLPAGEASSGDGSTTSDSASEPSAATESSP